MMLVVSRQPCFHNAACWPFVSSCTAPDWDSPFRVLENSSAAISSHLVRHDHIVLSTSLHGQRFRQLDFDRLLLPLHSNYRVVSDVAKKPAPLTSDRRRVTRTFLH